MTILNSQAHRSLRVQTGVSARYGDSQRFVQVILNEFPFLVVHYPILFAKNPETGAFICGALLGFDDGENLFLEESGGPAAYRPLNLRRGPFYTVGADLAVDLDNPRIHETEGQALFTETGEATPYLDGIVKIIRELQGGVDITKNFIETLVRLKLVETIEINAAFDDGVTRELLGLYTINQEVLRELPDATVLDLFRRGYLHLIYLMVASIKQVRVMAEKKNGRLLQATNNLPGL